MITTGQANLIKAQIAINLQALVDSGVLGAYIEKDINPQILDENYSNFPVAVLGTSQMQADWEYQQANKRVYTFDVFVIQLQDNVTDPGYIEDLRDAIALQFDNNVTLAGAAPLGVSAVMSPKMPVASKGKNYIVFYATIKATTLANLTYNF